jgi:hypothetical protein
MQDGRRALTGADATHLDCWWRGFGHRQGSPRFFGAILDAKRWFSHASSHIPALSSAQSDGSTTSVGPVKQLENSREFGLTGAMTQLGDSRRQPDAPGSFDFGTKGPRQDK